MKVYFYLRRTEDWANATNEDLLRSNGFCENWIKLNLQESLAYSSQSEVWKMPPFWWNKICSISWQEYRHRIKQVATSFWNAEQVVGDNFLDLDDEDIVIPVDDDDWFHPDLVNFLTKHGPDYDYGCWDVVVNNTAFNFNFELWTKYHKNICSNGYFFKANILKKIDYKKAMNILHNHSKTLEIAKHMGLKIMDRRDQVFALYNWHPGSISAMFQIKSIRDFKMLFPKGKMKTIPNYCTWAKDGVEKIETIIKDITFNKIPCDITVF